MSYRLLIVEDTLEILEAVSDFYREEGDGLWSVTTSSNGNDALDKALNGTYDLMILDIMLPGTSGFDICKAVRSRCDCPVIFLTALGSENNILRGYETGCDDYVVKPFSIRQLYAKSLALLKRSKGSTSNDDILSCGDISLNKRTMTVIVGGKDADIATREFFLLKYLLENKDLVLSRKQILDRVWGDNLNVNDRVVDNTIRRLRSCLGDSAACIKTMIGRGYKITGRH